jgi:hypothetical protein
MQECKKKNKELEQKLKEIKYEYMLKMAQDNQVVQAENEIKFQQEALMINTDENQEKEKEIHDNNTQLNEKSTFQRYEIDRIKKQMEKIVKLNKSYKRDMMLNAEAMEEYSKRQNAQNKKIKLLKNKIQILEKSLSQIVQDFEKEKTLLKKQNEDIIKSQESELQMLKAESRQRTKELKMLNSLSAVVLEQRSDIEQFFLEALEQIKEEIRKNIMFKNKTQK